MIHPTVITTAGTLTLMMKGQPVATIRAVPFTKTKSRYYFRWLDDGLTVVRSKEQHDGAETRA